MRRRKKHSHEEHENLERWLVSYADFITLLFAFFVVMYSISSVNEGKYKVLSDTLNLAFSDDRQSELQKRTLEPIQVGEIERGQNLPDAPIAPSEPTPAPDVIDVDGIRLEEERTHLQQMAIEIERVLAPFVQDDMIEVKRGDTWVEVEMKSGLLFSSGSAQLSASAVPMLEKLSDIIKRDRTSIHVEGHTDNKPINTHEFPSNWELSAARAASVVHQLMKTGIDPRRMSAIAYGEYHPKRDNGSEDGRYQNRRVTLRLQTQSTAAAGEGAPARDPTPRSPSH